MKLLALAVAATIATSGTASAATFYFQETTATNTASFSLDTSKETFAGIGFDFGQTAVTTSSGMSNVDVSTLLGFSINGSPAFTFEDPSGFGPSAGSFIADNFSNNAPTESFNVGTFTGQGSDQVPATLQISATPFASAVSAAPEPGAWALMLGGVGAMGLMLRSRRRQPKLARVAI